MHLGLKLKGGLSEGRARLLVNFSFLRHKTTKLHVGPKRIMANSFEVSLPPLLAVFSIVLSSLTLIRYHKVTKIKLKMVLDQVVLQDGIQHLLRRERRGGRISNLEKFWEKDHIRQ